MPAIIIISLFAEEEESIDCVNLSWIEWNSSWPHSIRKSFPSIAPCSFAPGIRVPVSGTEQNRHQSQYT